MAEGVENAAQHEFLIAEECVLFRGYLFGAPMSLAEFEAAVGQQGVMPAP